MNEETMVSSAELVEVQSRLELEIAKCKSSQKLLTSFTEANIYLEAQVDLLVARLNHILGITPPETETPDADPIPV